MTPFAKNLARITLQKAPWIFGIAMFSSIFGLINTIQLYQNLRPDLEELLPEKARSVVDYYKVSDRLVSTDELSLIVLSDHPKQSKAFVDDLAARIEAAPKNIIAGVEYQIKDDLEFFQKRKALFIEKSDLNTIKNYIQNRISYEQELFNPINIFRSTELPEPVYDFYRLRAKYDKKASSYDRYPDGYYATDDEKIRIIRINLPKVESKIAGARALRTKLDEIIADINPSSYDPEMKLLFSGGVQELIEEHGSLIRDLGKTTVVVLIFVTTALLIFYRSIRGTFALIVSLIIGTLWTFTAANFFIGYLNANSAFLGAIVLGNGINFGIIFLARYFEERRKKRGHARAVYAGITKTWLATVTAALAAGLSYGSLSVTEFRGFQQFGVIGLMGMLLCWISAFTVLPAFLTVLNRIKPISIRTKKINNSFFAKILVRIVYSYPKAIIAISALITIISIAAPLLPHNQVFETDLHKLRDKWSVTEGAGSFYSYVEKVFPGYPHPLVILGHSPSEALEIADKARFRMKNEKDSTLIEAVTAIDDFVPKDQDAKISILRKIQETLTPQITSQMSSVDRKLTNEFLIPESFHPFTVKELPPFVRKKMTEADGTIGNIVLIEPPPGDTTRQITTLTAFIGEVRKIADSVRPGTPVAGQIAVSSDLVTAIKKDGPFATAVSLIAVILLVIALFRKIQPTIIIVSTLVVGVIWLLPAIYFFEVKINFLNFIALPITFGISVDYGVNIYQRYSLERFPSILRTLRHTGSAVALASFTTIIGYGSLLLAGNQAFVSFGLLSVLGEITCILVALLTLPALLLLLERRGIKPNDI